MEIKHLLGKSPLEEALWILNTHATPWDQGLLHWAPGHTHPHRWGTVSGAETFPPLTINFLSGLFGHGPGMS